MNRTELHRLANARLREARILLEAGEWSGAYYLAGYAVECGLKACISKQTQEYDFPDKQRANDSFVHDLDKLMRVARLVNPHLAETRADERFRRYWAAVLRWSESSRYSMYDEAAARDMLEAVSNGEHGVLRWIMLFW